MIDEYFSRSRNTFDLKDNKELLQLVQQGRTLYYSEENLQSDEFSQTYSYQQWMMENND